MKRKPTIRTLSRRRDAILACQDLEGLAKLLGVKPHRLINLSTNPQYREFYIPKKNGKKRHIEDPIQMLKRVQDYLGDFLQAVYYFNRTKGAYGFMVRPADDPNPRHVLSNATLHLGAKWLLNMDMKDFFHTVKEEAVKIMFAAPLLDFPEDLCELLAGLVCYKGRLPMGAPTSPVISNLITIPLDQDLQYLADQQEWVYSRYADDMSFSSQQEIPSRMISEVTRIVQVWGFDINPTKNKLFTPKDDDQKAVTGLLVSGTEVQLPDDYLPQLEAAISHLSKVVDAKFLTSTGRSQSTKWLNDLQQGVKGKLAFAQHILGDNHWWVNRLRGAYLDAIQPPEDYGALSWLEFGYDFDFRNW